MKPVKKNIRVDIFNSNSSNIINIHNENLYFSLRRKLDIKFNRPIPIEIRYCIMDDMLYETQPH